MVHRYTGNMHVLPGVYTRKLIKIVYFGVHMPQSPNFNGIVPVQSWLEEQCLFPVIEHSISLIPFPVHLHIFSGAAGASAKERAPAYAGVKQQESQAPIFNAQHPFGVCFASFTVHADVSKPLALLYLPIGFVPVALHPSFQQTNSHVSSVSTSGSATAAGAATAAPLASPIHFFAYSQGFPVISLLSQD